MALPGVYVAAGGTSNAARCTATSAFGTSRVARSSWPFHWAAPERIKAEPDVSRPLPSRSGSSDEVIEQAQDE